MIDNMRNVCVCVCRLYHITLSIYVCVCVWFDLITKTCPFQYMRNKTEMPSYYKH